LSIRSRALSSLPLGFFWLSGQDAVRLVALKAGVFVKRGVGRIVQLGFIRRFLVVRFAGHGRAEGKITLAVVSLTSRMFLSV
jgi:hypothetical protein